MMNYLNPLIQGLGVAGGLIVGVLVSLLVKFVQQRRKEAEQTRNLRFELELNVTKIMAWLEEIGKYRNAVNGDSLHNYYGYFDLGRALFVTANKMLQSGLLYKKLSHDEIGQLQTISIDLSPASEQLLSNQVAEGRNLAERLQDGQMSVWVEKHKPQVVANIDYWERKFKTNKQVLEQITRSL